MIDEPNLLKIMKDNNLTTINQTYKVWKKHSPFLYSMLHTYRLGACSHTVEWFSDIYIENDWKMSNLLIGSNSLSQNSLQIMSVGLPTDDSLTDYTSYRDEQPEIGVAANGFIGTMGTQNLTIKIKIPQSGEVMKARINRFDQNIVAVKIGGANTQFIVYDLRNKEEELQNHCIKLEGHTQEGFGLAWSPHEASRLLSGSYDNKIHIYNIDKQETLENEWVCEDGVEDVKWSNFNQSIFASAHSDGKLNLWDIRSGQQRPFISRKANEGEVYSLDFNKKNEYLLLSGGADGDTNLWDVRNMSRKVHCFVGHNNAVNVVSWSPHNAINFATGSSDRRVVVWDMEKLNDNTKERGGNQILFIHGGHRSKVEDLSWNTEKSIVSSCQSDNIMQIWRMSDSLLSA